MWPICILNNYLHGKRLTREKAGSVQFADNGKSGVNHQFSLNNQKLIEIGFF